MIIPKNEKEDLLPSKTKNCETLIEQTHTKSHQTLELKITHPREIFTIKPPTPIEGLRMIGLESRSLQLFFQYNSRK